jgi:hypothetical protein
MRAPSDILVEFETPDGDEVLIVIVKDNVTTPPPPSSELTAMTDLPWPSSNDV